MTSRRKFRLGTRASQLARWQSDWVAAAWRQQGADVEIVEIATQGDVHQHGPIAALGEPGAFTKEIQAALLAGAVDLAVHSLKDLPTQSPHGLALAAVPQRAGPADALVAAVPLDNLPSAARVGTGSVRRRAQLLHLRPDLHLVPIRGNVDTRLRKLDAGDYDAIVLAAAGLERLGLAERIVELLEPPRMLPAPGQGALAIECRADDAQALQVAARLDDSSARLAVAAERTVLAALHGGCSAPIAAWARFAGGKLQLDALVADSHGRQVLRASGEELLSPATTESPLALAEALGRRVAADLARQGAAALVAQSRDL